MGYIFLIESFPLIPWTPDHMQWFTQDPRIFPTSISVLGILPYADLLRRTIGENGTARMKRPRVRGAPEIRMEFLDGDVDLFIGQTRLFKHPL